MSIHIRDRRLLLSPTCTVAAGPNGIVLQTPDDEVVIETNAPEAVRRVFRALQDGTCLAGLTAEDAAVVEQLHELLGELQEQNLLLDVHRSTAQSSPALTRGALEREARFWVRPIFEQPFWKELLQGKCTHGQVIGWGVEFFHFVEAANVYMALGVANTRHARFMRKHVSKHFVEEMAHGEMFLQGLEQSGIDRVSVINARPLPQTRALINLLSELALEGEVTYTAPFAVMQPGFQKPTLEGLDQFYGHLKQLYPYAAPMFEAFHRHAVCDVELQHDETVFAKLCQQGLDGTQRARAGFAIRSVAEAFMLFFEGIKDWYAPMHRYASRRPLYIAELA